MKEASASSFRRVFRISGGDSGRGEAAAHSGLFTEEEEAREQLEMAPEEIYAAQADVCGTHGDPGPPPSSPASFSASAVASHRSRNRSKSSASRVITSEGNPSVDEEETLAALDAELGKIPPGSKGAYLEALRQCPYELNAERRAAFLRREDFDTAAAAKRLVRYWERKLELFGPEKCYVPLTLERTLGDDEVSIISTGLHGVLPVKDDAGRAIVVIRAAKREMGMSREAVLRSLWYILHCALEDPEVQKRGFVFLLSNKGMTFSKFDPKLISCVLELERVYLPARMRACHHCFPPQFLRAINPIVKYVARRRGRSRLLVHGGSDGSLPEKLCRYGIAPHCLPRDFGGTLDFSHEQWLVDRVELEQQRWKDAANHLDVLATAVICMERRENSGLRGAGEGRKPNEQRPNVDQTEQRAKKMKESTLLSDDETSSTVSGFSPTPSPTLEAPQAAQPQAVDIQEQRSVPLVALPMSSVPASTSACSVGLPRPSLAVNERAVCGAIMGNSTAENQQQALMNAALLQLLQQKTQQLQGQMTSTAVAVPNLPSPALATTRGLGTVEVPKAARFMPQNSLSSPTVNSLLSVADAAALQQLLHPSAETPCIGARLHGQPELNSTRAETLLEALGVGTRTSNGASFHPNLGMSAAGISPTNAQQLHTALNQSSLQQGAANLSINELLQPNISVGGYMAALHQGGQSLSSSAQLQQQQQQPVLGPAPLPANTVDASILRLVQDSILVPALPDDSAPLQLPRILYITSDEMKLSSYQCLIRQQTEAFVATEEHEQTHARGRCKPIALGQVGIRCRHCRGLPLKCSPRGSIYFPAELVGMYQTAQKIATLHLASTTTPCPSMPTDVREQFHKLFASKSTVGGGKHYWAEAGRKIGLMDSPNGICFNNG